MVVVFIRLQLLLLWWGDGGAIDHHGVYVYVVAVSGGHCSLQEKVVDSSVYVCSLEEDANCYEMGWAGRWCDDVCT